MIERSVVEIERHRRILLSVAAFAYELRSHSIMPDWKYDQLCKQVDVSIDTGNAEMDAFFREHFNPDTGMWIWQHPDQDGLERIYEKYFMDLPTTQ